MSTNVTNIPTSVLLSLSNINKKDFLRIMILKARQKVKQSLLNFFKKYYLFEEKKQQLIKNIILLRSKCAVKIQRYFKSYLKRQKLFSFAKKNQLFYSLYPSKEVEKKISIKLYTNPRDSRSHIILPVHFCNYRNKYVFDIPKSKFPSSKKYLKFKFIIDGTVFLDPKYKLVRFGENYVNKVDFNDYERKQKVLWDIMDEIIYYNKTYKKVKTKKNNYKKEESKINNIYNNQKNKSFTFISDHPFFNSNNDHHYTRRIIKLKDSDSGSENEEREKKGSFFREKNYKEKRLKSKSRDNKPVKKVSFGFVKFSY